MPSCLVHGFYDFRGVPQSILTDNMKTVVLRRMGIALDRHTCDKGICTFARPGRQECLWLYSASQGQLSLCMGSRACHILLLGVVLEV